MKFVMFLHNYYQFKKDCLLQNITDCMAQNSLISWSKNTLLGCVVVTAVIYGVKDNSYSRLWPSVCLTAVNYQHCIIKCVHSKLCFREAYFRFPIICVSLQYLNSMCCQLCIIFNFKLAFKPFKSIFTDLPGIVPVLKHR